MPTNHTIRPRIDLRTMITNFVNVSSKEEFAEVMALLTKELKLKHFWHMFAPNIIKSKKQQQLSTINNHPDGFEDEYIRGNKRAFECPVLHYAYQTSQVPLLWSELYDIDSLNEEQQDILEWYCDYRLYEGISYTIHEPGNEYAVLTFILDERVRLTPEEIVQVKEYLIVLSNIIHHKYKTYVEPEPTLLHKTKLTARESECLIWAARGKTAWETSMILGISEYTVNEHLANAMRKLDVTTKVAAVSKAILTSEILYTDLIK